jgi:cytochrome c553
MKAFISLLIGAFVVTFSAQSMAADPANGEKLSQTCMGCHGAPGLRNASPVFHVPMIGGQHAAYIVSALQAYKNKDRSHPTMQAQAASLSDQDMQDIAAYFEALSGNTRAGHSSRAAAGKEKSATCAACHGIDGNGDNTTYPILAGQYASYMEVALKDYRSGKRQNAIMAGFAASLTIEDIRDLAAYYASQKGGLSAPVIKIKK